MFKKFASVALACVLLFMRVPVSADRGPDSGFSVSGVKSFAVSGADYADKMINTVSSDDTETISALTGVLNAAANAEAPAGSVITAKLRLALDSGETRDFLILASGGRLYARDGGKTLELDAEAFHLAMNAFGNTLYKYRAVPSITARLGNSELKGAYIDSATYAYRKLDDRFYKPWYVNEIASPQTFSTAGGWSSLAFSTEPDYYTVLVYTQGKANPVFASATLEAAGDYVSRNPGGSYVVKIKAGFKDSRDSMYQGEVTYAFTASASTETEIALLEPDNTYPGEMVVMRISNYKQGDAISFKSGINFTPVFYDDGKGGKIALLPVSYYTSLGEQSITLTCGDKSATWKVSVKDKKFQIQNLTVNESTASSTIDSTAANNEYERVIAPLRFVGDVQKHYDGFVWPVTGKRSTEFGMIRYVNGAPTSSRHGAIDFAVPLGTTVKSTAAGRVLFAGYLQLTGNTVLIEHGYGLKSWYYHMNSLNVKTGDMVAMSQKIGEVGSTGFSTGPHLHFGMSVNNVFVNPDTVIGTDLLA